MNVRRQLKLLIGDPNVNEIPPIPEGKANTFVAELKSDLESRGITCLRDGSEIIVCMKNEEDPRRAIGYS